MDQNEASKGTEMKRNVPTSAQLTKISQNSEKPVKNENVAKFIEVTRTQLIEIKQIDLNPREMSQN